MEPGRSGRKLIEGRYFEGPRWYANRLWVSDAVSRCVWSADVDGKKTRLCTMEDIPCGLGHLPNGELVIVGMFQKSLRRAHDEADRHAIVQ